MTQTNHDPLSLSNLLRPEVRANPYALYAQMRAEDPVHWDEPMGFWALTRYADVVALLHEPQVSKARGMEAGLERLPAGERESAKPLYESFARQMLFADPPYHTRLRSLANRAFTPRVVEPMRAHIQQTVDGLLDAVQAKGRMDLIHDFAYPLPTTTIMEMIGLPQADRERFKQWSDDFMATLGMVRRDPAIVRRAVQSLHEVTDYICNLHEELHQSPREDLLSALVRIEEEGSGLSHEELVANTMLLLAAGHETTTNLIGNGLLALLLNPEQMRRLKDEPALIDRAVEELLRYDGPVQILWRVATADLAIGGKQIREGQMVNAVIGAANRDPAQFPEPDRLDLGRHDSRHIEFGLGIHFCLGSPLARLEGRMAIETVLRRMPNLRLEVDAAGLEWQTNPIFRGLKALPVAF